MEAVMRLNEEFNNDEEAPSALTWAGGAAVTAGIILVLAAAQIAA